MAHGSTQRRQTPYTDPIARRDHPPQQPPILSITNIVHHTDRCPTAKFSSPFSRFAFSHTHGRRQLSPGLEKVKNLLTKTGVPSITTSPYESLQRGNWVKLICGASFEDVVDIRNLSLVYSLAGVGCIDCAANASVVSAVNEGIEAAIGIVPVRRP
ncbi:unnamed protein product [Ilex paraguariensis]|uniref:Uncharacterized protein n=1 Tax=Ilex paraguariensis TaxID=185542 RepID=A0ABC8TJ24_9AQUA